MNTEIKLVRYDAMRHAIAKCYQVDEISQIRNKARQLEAAAKVANDRKAVMMTTEIVVRAERRLGQLLEATPKAKARRGSAKVPSRNRVPAHAR